MHGHTGRVNSDVSADVHVAGSPPVPLARSDVHADLAVTPEPVGASPESLAVLNLHSTLPELAGLVGVALERESWLDAFLLTAGMSQLVDDYLEGDPLSLGRISSFLANDGGGVGRVLAGATRPGASALARAATIRPAVAGVQRLGATLESALEALAELIIGVEEAPGAGQALRELSNASELVHRGSARLPDQLSEDIVRLPACFRSFDQHPDDLRRLARVFSARADDRLEPLLVVGVRTSGSYLGPLLAASLRAEGYGDVSAITLRPGRRLSAPHRAIVLAIAARGGRALVCDDPPGTGGSIARAASDLAQLGIPRERTVLALALFAGDEGLPERLASYPSVLLPYDEWSIHSRMSPEAVRESADALLGEGRRVTAAELQALRSPRNGRGHLKATFALSVLDDQTDSTDELGVSVESVGLGYFGTHAVAVAERLREFLPPVLGVDDGLLLRGWLPKEARAEYLLPAAREAVAARVAAYAFARNQRLPLAQDVTLRQSGQYPAWEAASTALSRAFGRGWALGRTLIADRAVKRILRVAQPSVVDGRVAISQWFAVDGPTDLVKVDWDQGASWNLGLGCCDPVFDLAGMTAASDDLQLGGELRRAYESLAGTAVDEERWLLYELAHLSAPDAPREARHELGRARSRALQRYFRSVYFEDLIASTSGPLGGIDLDGVLETEHLGVPALTPASALGLRALTVHGFRPLLVTGRSLSEVIERCRAYTLAGAVAEYGCVMFNSRTDSVEILTSAEEQQVVDRLRAELRSREGVTLDEDYAHAIRAFVRDGSGRRRPLPDELIDDARRSADAQNVSLIVGDSQTDIVPGAVDKGRGARAIASALGDGAPATPLAFAVGDTATDRPLLALAAQAFAPAHSRAALAGAATITRGAYQRGFAEAVGSLIGHAPGDCPDCRPSPQSRERRLLLGLLGVGERGTAMIPFETAKLSRLAA
jgi:hypothetical protein